MICKNCGMEVNDFSTNCPNCGAYVAHNSDMYGNSTYQQSSQTSIKTTGLLVWSIIELICLSPIFGLIALILYFTKLKPAVDSGNINEAMQSKRTIKILLWVGIALSIIPILMMIILVAIPNFSGIHGRMEIRADKATAAQVGKAVRIWYTDDIVDAGIDYNCEEINDGFVKLDEMESLDQYLDVTLAPSSYRDRYGKITEADYYVAMTDDDKIVVAIASEEDNLNSIFRRIDSTDEADYYGMEAGIAYIEPDTNM